MIMVCGASRSCECFLLLKHKCSFQSFFAVRKERAVVGVVVYNNDLKFDDAFFLMRQVNVPVFFLNQ